MAAALFRRHYRVDLTPRQRQVLDLVAKGRTNFEIAQELGISLDGAKWHLRELFAKLGVESREEAAAWWRDYNAAKQRLARAARALFPVTLGKWLLGATASVAVVVGLVVAVVVAQQNTETGQDSPAATGIASPSVTASPEPDAETVLDVPVRHWSTTQPETIPPGLSFIMEHGCTQCDGPTASLERVNGLANGQVERKTLFAAPGNADGYILTYAVDPQGAEFYITVCSRGNCGGVGRVTDDAQTTVYHSMDGGVTWEKQQTYAPPAAVRRIGDEWILDATRYDEMTGTFIYDYSRYPSGDELPALPKTPTVAPSFVSQLAGKVSSSFGIIATSVSPSGEALVRWMPVDSNQQVEYIGRLYDGKLADVLASEVAGDFTVIGWLSDTVAAGNAPIPSRLLSDVDDPDAIPFVTMPALLDFGKGTITPVYTSGSTSATAQLQDRNRVVNVQFGPFALVHTSGDCLNVRESASTSAQSLGCFADGVLLRLGGEEKQADGQKWQAVTTPMGKDGWASEAFLTR